MERFEDVARLEPSTLRALLHAELPRVRVWATWALALRVGAGAQAELARTLREEPEPGVRRHLLVVLAGAGETALLELLACEDPDAYVRAAACRLLAAVLPPGDVSVRRRMLERLAHDAGSEVRVEALRALGPVHEVDAEVSIVAGVLGDADAEVRALALDALVTCGAHLRSDVRARLEREPDAALRQRALAAWHASLGGAGLLALFGDAAPARLEEVLTFLARREAGALPWEALAPLAARDVPALDLHVLGLLVRDAVAPPVRAWLLARVTRAARMEGQGWSSPEVRAGSAALPQLLRALEAAQVLTPKEQAQLPEVVRWLDAAQRFWEEEELTPPPEGTLEEALLSQLERLRRLS